MSHQASTQSLVELMSALRDPKTGCPWDIKQTFETIAPYTVEEAYEVTDAIEKKDFDELKNELGDLLLQVLFHSQMADEAGHFNLQDVMQTLADKLVRRHPHVFTPDGEPLALVEQTSREQDVKHRWETIKQQERLEKSTNTVENVSIIDDIGAMPALMRAHKLQKRVASVGFDWPSVQPVLAKVHEELSEVEVEIHAQDPQKQQEEVGDLLFVVANLARHLGFNAEQCLQQANVKFTRRFQAVEQKVRDTGSTLQERSLSELDALWNTVKAEESTHNDSATNPLTR